MEILKNFFECYFNQSFYFDDLDKIIQDLNNPGDEAYRLQLITELHQIIQTQSYDLASRLMKKYAGKILNLELTEKVIKFMYNRLMGQPAFLDRKDFVKDYKVVFCPVCCPNPETAKTFSLIEKATVAGKKLQVYICKSCWLVWLTEDIRADNAQDYKKFMKKLGLKGQWDELCDIDTL